MTAAWWVRVPRDFVRVSGPDARSFLQGQLSQDVDALAIGDSAPSFLLQPQGKVDAYLRVTRTDDDAFVLDVDRGWGDAVVTRLTRFKLRTKADVERIDGWSCIGAVSGDGHVTELVGADVRADGDEGDPLLYEVLRIKAGVPRMGSEIDETTIPNAVGVVDRAVSFTKGCYTGQELVARIDSRGGNTPTKLVGVRGRASAGDAVTVDGRDVGRVTSAAGDVALAYVRRDVELPSTSNLGVLESLPLT
ncbi:MAG: tRNA-modifying protein YgfZ [Actinomycetota bacterium]|nr:tRNA-modifying protein YgfZ [Actinomycetota bacterium]